MGTAKNRGLYKRGKVWWADFSINGERFQKSLGTGRWNEALSRKKELEATAQEGKLAPKAQKFGARVAFGEAADRYSAERLAHLAPRSIATERERLKPLRKYFAGTTLNAISTDSILAYVSERKKDKASIRVCLTESKNLAHLFLVNSGGRDIPENQGRTHVSLRGRQRCFIHVPIHGEILHRNEHGLAICKLWNGSPARYTLVIDQQRNDLIVKDMQQVLSDGRSPLVLTSRKEHLDYLAGRLRGICQHIFVLKGGMGARQRKKVAESLSLVSPDEPRIILATGSYLGEGFDDARLDTLFLSMPISWKGTLQQYVGRLHRLHENKKEVRVYDYADLLVPMLARMYKKRLAGYSALGYIVAEGPRT
jgi:hypothetical protein